jgi:hypothetical protein
MSKCCGTCNAFQVNPTNVRQGQCHANPPVPILLGVKPGPGGSMMPIVQGVWPPIDASYYCRQWEDKVTSFMSERRG